LDTIDVTNAVLRFASDEGRYLTGVTLSIDAGSSLK
jgi:(+)-trans-carveol dehydrogenase